MFKQGDKADAFYVILKGRVGIYITSDIVKHKRKNDDVESKQQTIKITTLNAGQSFGELGLLSNHRDDATRYT